METLLGLFSSWILLCLASGSSDVVQIGNRIAASASGVDVPGVSFLVDDLILAEGVLFAYSAFFRSDKPVRFQIWRPESAGKDDRSFKLISDLRVIPSVTEQREDVYIESKLGTAPCVRVHQGDRLGLYLEGAPGAVAYSFDARNPMALGHTVSNLSDPVKVGQVVHFDTLTFPYDFNMAAYLHLDLSGYDPADEFPPCPKGLLIPDYIAPTLAPTAAPTGKPGATGATGPRGTEGAPGMRGATGATGPMGATGMQGPVGVVGSIGATGPVGPQGVEGPVGATGATGPQGEKGDQGPPGPAGASALVGGSSDDFLSHTFLQQHPMWNLILLIWLAVVTLILIIVIIVLIVVARKRQRRLPYEKRTSVSSSDIKPWHNTLRREEEMYASNPSIVSGPSHTSSSDLTISTIGSERHLGDFTYRPSNSHIPAYNFDESDSPVKHQ